MKQLKDLTPEEAAPIMEAWRTGVLLNYRTHIDGDLWGNGTVLRTEYYYQMPVTIETLTAERDALRSALKEFYDTGTNGNGYFKGLAFIGYDLVDAWDTAKKALTTKEMNYER